MIQAKIEIDTDIGADVGAYVDAFDVVNADLGEEVARVIEPDLLDELGTEPGPVQYPIQWTSERQRRAFFATNGFGKGIPYKRTGKLARSWTVTTRVEGGTFQLVVRNPAAPAQFVYGTLNQQSLSNAMKPQQQFHRNTGWQTAVKTVNFWFEAAQEEYERRFDDELGEFGRLKKTRRRSRRS